MIQFVEARHIPSFTTTKYEDSPESSFTNVFDETSSENKTCIAAQEKQDTQDDFEYPSRCLTILCFTNKIVVKSKQFFLITAK